MNKFMLLVVLMSSCRPDGMEKTSEYEVKPNA